jgi:molecular chaperone DnaJ
MSPNFYDVLGVSVDASLEEIQQAHRRLARSTHPDVSGKDSAARFREIQEAWETLRDPERRHAYDAELQRALQGRVRPVLSGVTSPNPPEPSGPPWEPASPDPETGWKWKGSKHGGARILHLTLEMTTKEAAAGGSLPVRLCYPVPCTTCKGRGYISVFLCSTCYGQREQTTGRMIVIHVPPGIRPGDTLEVMLDAHGLPWTQLVLHAHIQPF